MTVSIGDAGRLAKTGSRWRNLLRRFRPTSATTRTGDAPTPCRAEPAQRIPPPCRMTVSVGDAGRRAETESRWRNLLRRFRPTSATTRTGDAPTPCRAEPAQRIPPPCRMTVSVGDAGRRAETESRWRNLLRRFRPTSATTRTGDAPTPCRAEPAQRIPPCDDRVAGRSGIVAIGRATPSDGPPADQDLGGVSWYCAGGSAPSRLRTK